MSAKSEPQQPATDTPKMIAAAVIAVLGVVAFYYFEDALLLIRVIGLLVAVGIAAAIMLTTEPGRTFIGFYNDSRVELRKVVWPTREETLKTSGIIIALVFVMAIFLWLLDRFLFWLVRLLTG